MDKTYQPNDSEEIVTYSPNMLGRIIRLIPDIFMSHKRFHIVQPRQDKFLLHFSCSSYTSREELGGVWGVGRGCIQNPDQKEHALHTLSYLVAAQRNDKTFAKVKWRQV